MGEMAHQHLPPQIQDFIHDVPEPVEEIAFISLRNMQMCAVGHQFPYGEGRSQTLLLRMLAAYRHTLH